jgi:uncharacterized membrane protein
MTDNELADRLAGMDRRLAELTRRMYLLEQRGAEPSPEPRTVEAPPAPEPQPEIRPEVRPAALDALPIPAFARARESEARTTAEWEALLGGDWLNKIGACILVIGIALALGYSFQYMGPGGRDGVGVAAGFALLGTGVYHERRPRYRTFARGLIGAGWATLYFTVYAMQALAAARVVRSPTLGALLLVTVASGMIAHALRYRSEAAAGVAFFGAFLALAVTEATSFPSIALVPLAGSLLYVAQRFGWSRLAALGVAATYVTCAWRGDTGVPLWQAQAMFGVYWLLFEAFDLIRPTVWIAPLNAAGFLFLSLAKWHGASPGDVWILLAASAAAYVLSGALRARVNPEAAPLAGGWHASATVAAALATAASFEGLDGSRQPFALLAEGEACLLCGVLFRQRYLQWLAAPLMAMTALVVIFTPDSGGAARLWNMAAGLTVAAFYANWAVADAPGYGYAAAAMLALIGGRKVPASAAGRMWMLTAAGPFLLGWYKRLADFRYQGYLLAALGAFATMVTMPHPPLSTAIGTAVTYAMAAFALWSPADRFKAREREILFPVAAAAGAIGLAALLYQEFPGSVRTVAWGVQGLALLMAGLPLRERALRLTGLAVLLVCILKLFVYDLSYLETLPRIFSFIALGLILVGVSWIYTHFRERLRCYL